MSRLARIRNRADYYSGSDIEAVEVEPALTPMADARARSAALEQLHARDAQQSDSVPVFDPPSDFGAAN